MANITRRGGEYTPSTTYGISVDPFRMMRDLLGYESSREGWGEHVHAWTPHFEVFERKDAYVFKADLPGVKENDVDITLTENRLTISGKRDAEQKNEGETFYAMERSYGTFTRSFTLPDGVDAEHVQAEMKDGVLNLIVPKKPEVQPKKIEIRPNAGKSKQ